MLNIWGFNKSVPLNGSTLVKHDFMGMVYGFIYQSLHVDLWVIKEYVLEFIFNKSHLFNQGWIIGENKFIYRFQRNL